MRCTERHLVQSLSAVLEPRGVSTRQLGVPFDAVEVPVPPCFPYSDPRMCDVRFRTDVPSLFV